jgi:hypothetical protein
MVTKKNEVKKGTKGGALDNFFPDVASEAVKDSVNVAKGDGGRLANVGSDVEVVTVPPPAAKGVSVEAEVNEEVLEDNLGAIPAVDEFTGATNEADKRPEDEGAPIPSGKVKGPIGTGKSEAPLERSDNEIAEALEQNEERKSDILIGLGFNKYDDNDGKIKYSILENDIKIGVTFDEKNPEGNVWAIYKESTEDYKSGVTKEGKEGAFLSPDARSQQLLLQKYYAILKGEEPIPKPVVIGKVVEKRGGSIGIEFEEEAGGPRTEYYPATDAVKRDKEGYFIAKGFSKEWKDRNAKMHFPRAIRLPNYEQELKGAPISEPSSQEVLRPDHSGTQTSTSTPTVTPAPLVREASRAPTVTLEEKKRQIASNLDWAVGAAVDVYKKQVKDQVPIEDGLGVFIEKIAVTAFITLQKSLKCVDG